LQFDHANRTTATTGSFEVLWNGQVIATYSDVGLAMKAEALIVTAVAGNNNLGFRSIGPADSVGASLDNVRLQAIDPTRITGVTLSGLAGNDMLTGSIGNDILSGGTGDDILSGGFGDDVYLFDQGDGQDVIHDLNGINELRFGQGIDSTQVRLVRGTSQAILEIAGNSDRIALSDIGTVSYSTLINPSRVTLSLRKPGAFGDEVTFCAPLCLVPFASHPVINKLIERIDVAPDDVSVTLHAAGICSLVAELASEEAVERAIPEAAE